MNEYYFGDWNWSSKKDYQAFTNLLNVLINWYGSEIKNFDVEKCYVDFIMDDSFDDENFLDKSNFFER